MDKLLRYDDLVERGVVRNRTTLYRWIKTKNFPSPVKLGNQTVAWPAAAVEAWVEAQNSAPAEAA